MSLAETKIVDLDFVDEQIGLRHWLTARSELKMFKEGREALEHIENNHKGAR